MGLADVSISRSEFDFVYDHMATYEPPEIRYGNMHLRETRQRKKKRILRSLHAMRVRPGSESVGDHGNARIPEHSKRAPNRAGDWAKLGASNAARSRSARSEHRGFGRSLTDETDVAVRDDRSTGYWVGHGVVTGVSLLGAGLATRIDASSEEATGARDRSLRGTYSSTAANFSDATLLMSLGIMLPPIAAASSRPEFANAGLIYAEVLSLNLGLNSVAKYAFRRPRPYTYDSTGQYKCVEEDDCLSFYSGHSSTAFAAATSSAYLFSEVSKVPPGLKAGAWGLQLMLAGASARLRVRAGKHFYSDVGTGMLIGAAFGLGIPTLAHGSRHVPNPWEIIAAPSGLVLGMALADLVPSGRSSYYERQLMLAPLYVERGTGLLLGGAW